MGKLIEPADAPLCSREEFDALVDGMVKDEAPRIFAVVQELGDRLDGRIAGWGMAFEEYADIAGVCGRFRARLVRPENALRMFRGGPSITARVVWVPGT